MDDMSMKHSALGNIRKMLKDGRAKRLGALGMPKAEEKAGEPKPEEKLPMKGGKPAIMEIHAMKLAPAEGSPEEEDCESPEEAAAEGDEPEHPLHAAMKKLNQIIRPRG